MTHNKQISILAAFTILLFSCGSPLLSPTQSEPQALGPDSGTKAASLPGVPTPLPVRPNYKPGELVDYSAQSGDTLPSLAAHFNTTISEIRAANPIIPPDATTMPPGFPMKIPVYFKALWASPYQIMPDSGFVNGPSEIGFNTSAFVASQPGWFLNYRAYVPSAGRDLSGAEIIDYVSTNWSISPRLLLAILEYKSNALTARTPPAKKYIMDYPQPIYAGASNLNYLQLVWAANTLNNGYYGWRSGQLTEFYEADGTIIRPDPWQNAASVAIQYFFSRTAVGEAFETAIGPNGLASTYQTLFGDPWTDNIELIPGSLQQPALRLPFPPAQVWTLTGGPHTGWGLGPPYAALDFAPPCDHPGCASLDPSNYVIAMADGLVVRSGPDGLILDLDGDGNERTGWVIFYLHLAARTRAPVGKQLHAGNMIGYPSSEGGESTGTHVHIARKYNGEWILAGGVLPFNLDGWVAHEGKAAYQGTLTRNGLTVTACPCSDFRTEIRSDARP
jgi:murein DD-endopeptidase MepM/ murein hydrolase activator NlpD